MSEEYLCCLCRQPLNVTAPHAIVSNDFAHIRCANEYDAQDRGALDNIEKLNYFDLWGTTK